MKRYVAFFCAVFAIVLFTGCGKNTKSSDALVIGASQVPHAQILENIKGDLKKEGIKLEVKVFQDFVLPNKYVAEDQIDANYFQHIPWMEIVNKEQGYQLVSVCPVHLEPMGAYSRTVKCKEEIPQKAKVAIPNGPSEITRALRLLEKNNLITLGEGSTKNGNLTPKDIDQNPKQLQFTLLEPSVLPRVLSEVDVALINTNYALKARLQPLQDNLFIEDSTSPYANVLTTKKGKEKNPAIVKLSELLQSEKTKKFILDNYGGAIIPAS